MRDLLDSYNEHEVTADINALVTAGEIIAIVNTEAKDKILFPRKETFLVELDGLVAIPPPKPKPTEEEDDKKDKAIKKEESEEKADDDNSMPPPPPPEVVLVETDVDPQTQIRRGEAVQVGGQWFRVSSAVKQGPLSEQPARAQAPLSVVSLVDLSKRNGACNHYIRIIRHLYSSSVSYLSLAHRRTFCRS